VQLGDLAYHCCSVIGLIHNILVLTPSETQCKVFHADAPERLLSAYENAIPVLRRPLEFVENHPNKRIPGRSFRTVLTTDQPVDTAREQLKALTRRILLDCSESSIADSSRQTYWALLEFIGTYGTPAPSPFDRLVLELESMSADQRCHAPTRIKTLADSHLRVCAGCHSVRYCSRRCQKRAWTHPRAGHRLWCAQIDIATSISAPDEAQASHVLACLEQLNLSKLEALNPDVQICII
jgi:hypothetical protein